MINDIVDNDAYYGGGLAFKMNASGSFTNVSIIGNVATQENWGMGGGIYCDQNANLNFDSVLSLYFLSIQSRIVPT